MRYFGNLFWGALLLMLGIIALLWATDVIENIAFLKVWWPMFMFSSSTVAVSSRTSRPPQPSLAQ